MGADTMIAKSVGCWTFIFDVQLNHEADLVKCLLLTIFDSIVDIVNILNMEVAWKLLNHKISVTVSYFFHIGLML